MMKAIKNEPFDGQFFKRISEKVIFYGACRRHAPFFCTKAETIRFIIMQPLIVLRGIINSKDIFLKLGCIDLTFKKRGRIRGIERWLRV